MSQVLRRERQESAIADRPTADARPRVRPHVIAFVVAVALLVGMAVGWAAFTTATSEPSVEDVQRTRAEAMVDYHEQLWRSRAQEIQRARAESMVDHYERQWRHQQGGQGR